MLHVSWEFDRHTKCPQQSFIWAWPELVQGQSSIALIPLDPTVQVYLMALSMLCMTSLWSVIEWALQI
jgi:hypothetical protein